MLQCSVAWARLTVTSMHHASLVAVVIVHCHTDDDEDDVDDDGS